LLALLSHDTSNEDEMLRLLYLGIYGFVSVTDQLAEELPRALQALISGNFWVPDRVIREYVRQSNMLLDPQLLPDCRLTARENQTLQLMVRRLSNKEIGGAFGISERTVKFHVSNIFAKFNVQDRHHLLTTINLVGSPKPLGA